MSLSRRNPRRDYKEAEIVSALQQIGVYVMRISGPGNPDLLCHFRGQWLPMEVKGPRGRLTHAQVQTRAQAPYPVVRSVGEALAHFGVQG